MSVRPQSAEVWPLFDRDGLNDHECLREREIIRDRQVDDRAVARWQQPFETQGRAIRQVHGRPTARQVHNSHVAPKYPVGYSGAERLGAGLLGRESLGVGCRARPATFRASPFDIREYPGNEALAMALERLLDPPYV